MKKRDRFGVFTGDSVKINLKDYTPSGEPVPYGTNVDGVYFDGYPQLVKEEASRTQVRDKKGKGHNGCHA